MKSRVYLSAALGAAIACCGCTTMSLEQHSVNQIRSVADYRYRQTLDCLARAAANPASLPPYSLLSAGTAKVADTGTLASATVWQHVVSATNPVSGFASENLGATASRSPTESWTLISIAEHSQLEAMRCACRWVLSGPDEACGSCPGLLASPEQDPSPGPHFGVADRLRRLPPGWLHVGRCKEIPPGAPYTGHCGDTWVWVTRDGLEGLADFTLVLQDIATLDTGASTRPQIVLTLRWTEPPPVPGASEIVCTEARVVKPEYVATVNALLFSEAPLDVSREDWERYTTPLPGRRTNISPTGPSSFLAGLRSELSAERTAAPERPFKFGAGPFPESPFSFSKGPFEQP